MRLRGVRSHGAEDRSRASSLSIATATVAVLGCALAFGVGLPSPAAQALASPHAGKSGSGPFGGDPFTNRDSAPASSAAVAASATPAAQSTIEVEANLTDVTISPAVMGSTYLPPFGGMGSFDSSTDSFWPSFLSDLEDQVYTGSIRWPGGILAQYYDFRSPLPRTQEPLPRNPKIDAPGRLDRRSGQPPPNRNRPQSRNDIDPAQPETASR